MAGRPRIRFRKPRPEQPQAGNASGAATQQAPTGSEKTATQPASAQQPSAARAPAAGAQAAGSATTTPKGAAGATNASKADVDPQEQIDGLRAWLADLDRKLGVRTYIGAALAVLALAAAGAALFLTLSLKQDAATKDEVNALRDQLSSVEQFAAAAAHNSVRSLDKRLADLETKVNKLSTDQTTSKRELQVIQDDIKELRSQVSGGTAPSTGSFGGGTGTGAGTGLGGSATGTGTGGGSTGAGTGGTGQ
ncbi:MAG: hypothetical protein ACRDMH_14400 [Solirubrobacterales bacterium]